MFKYVILIDELNVQDNAPEWACMIVDYDEDFILHLNSKHYFITQLDKFKDDLDEKISESISYDIENDVEIFSITYKYKILQVIEFDERNNKVIRNEIFR